MKVVKTHLDQVITLDMLGEFKPNIDKGHQILIYPENLRLNQKQEIFEIIQEQLKSHVENNYLKYLKAGLDGITDYEIDWQVSLVPEKQKLHLIETWHKPPDTENERWTLITFYTIMKNEYPHYNVDGKIIQMNYLYCPVIHQMIDGSSEVFDFFWRRWGRPGLFIPVPNYYCACPFSYPEDFSTYLGSGQIEETRIGLEEIAYNSLELKEIAYNNLRQLEIPVEKPLSFL